MTVKVGLVETVSLPALYRKVRPDECTWTIEGGSKVIATLAKVGGGARGNRLTRVLRFESRLWFQIVKNT